MGAEIMEPKVSKVCYSIIDYYWENVYLATHRRELLLGGHVLLLSQCLLILVRPAGQIRHFSKPNRRLFPCRPRVDDWFPRSAPNQLCSWALLRAAAGLIVKTWPIGRQVA
jgi:hypothetical protein